MDSNTTKARALDVVDKILRLISLVLAAIALIIVIAVLFVVFEANSANSIVSTIKDWAGDLLGPIRTLFTPDGAKKSALINGGIGAVIYLIGARIVLALSPARRGV